VLAAREGTMPVIERFERLLGRQRIREKEKAERGMRLVGAHVGAAGIRAALCPGRREKRVTVRPEILTKLERVSLQDAGSGRVGVRGQTARNLLDNFKPFGYCMRGPWGDSPDPANNFIPTSDTEGKVALFKTLVPPAVERGIEAANANQGPPKKDVLEVKCSEFADAISANK
jgi:hypothetical protein